MRVEGRLLLWGERWRGLRLRKREGVRVSGGSQGRDGGVFGELELQLSRTLMRTS